MIFPDQYRTTATLAYRPRSGQPPVRVLVCGLGSIGQRHVENIATLGALPLAWRARSQQAEEARQRLKIPVYTDIQQAMKECDAVVVATATDQHMPVAIAAAQQGKPIFVEKPISHNLDNIDKFVELAKNLVVEVGCQLRAHPALRELASYLATGEAGNILTYQFAVGQRLDTWRKQTDYRKCYSANIDRGGGALMDLIHEIDLACWFAGPTEQVFCRQSNTGLFEIQGDDISNLILSHHNGAVGQVQMDMISPNYRRHFELVTNRAIFYWNDSDGTVYCHDANKKQALFRPPADLTRNSLFLDHMSHFLARINQAEEAALCTLDQSVSVLKTVLSARQSHLSNRTESVSSQAVGSKL